MEIESSKLAMAFTAGIIMVLVFTTYVSDLARVYKGVTVPDELERVSTNLLYTMNDTTSSITTTIQSGDWIATTYVVIFIAPMNAARALFAIISGSISMTQIMISQGVAAPPWATTVAYVLISLTFVFAILSALLKWKV